MKNKEKESKFHTFLMYFGQALGCHQKPERSFFCKRQCFLCSRCLGVFIGQLIGIPLYFLHIHLGFYTALLMIPLFLDGGLQYVKILNSNNKRRLITGLLCGYAIIITFIHVIYKLIIL